MMLPIAFLLALLVIAIQVTHKGIRAPERDEFAYLSIANDLNVHGVFSDGRFAEHKTVGAAEPGRFFAPAYPLFLYAMSSISPATRVFVDCNAAEGTSQANCPKAPISLLAVQAVMAALGMTCIFAASYLLSGSLVVAGLAEALALATGEPGYYVRTYLSENTAFLGFYVFLASAVWAVARNRLAGFALAGAALSFAALSRPSYLYLIYLAVLILATAAILHPKLPIRWQQLGAFVSTAFVVLAPWMLRNFWNFGDVALTSGYGGFILVQRVAYNSMTWTEWGVSLIAWLPDFGDSLARSLFPSDTYIRLGWDDPTSFYAIGNGQLMQETLAASGGRSGHLSYLLHNYVLAEPFKHLAVTLPLTLRGIWVGKYLALAATLLVIPVGREMARRQCILPFLVLVMPPLLMAAFHALISVNVVRYNVPMIAPYAFIVAFSIVVIAPRDIRWLRLFLFQRKGA